MAFVTVHITGLKETIDKLDTVALKLKDFTSAMETLGVEIGKYFSGQVFASEGAVLGERWAPLAQSTVAEKAALWPGRGILERTGTMRQAFEHDVTPMSVWIKNDTPYFPYHQLGTSGGAGRGHNIPARPMMGINEPVKSIIRQVIEADIAEKLRGL